MRLEPLLEPERTLVVEDPGDAEGVLERVAALGARACGSACDTGTLLETLREREGTYPTSTAEGVAFPHAVLEQVGETIVVALLLRKGVKFPASGGDGKGSVAGAVGGSAAGSPAGGGHEVDLVFGMFGPASKPFQHVRLLARLARVVHSESARRRLRGAAGDAEFLERLVEEDRSHG